MRKHIFRLVVTVLTFAIGIAVSSLCKQLVTNNYDSIEISEPLQLEPIKAKKVCELHGSVMNNEVVHAVKDYRSPEAALFESHLVGGASIWVFGKNTLRQ